LLSEVLLTIYQKPATQATTPKSNGKRKAESSPAPSSTTIPKKAKSDSSPTPTPKKKVKKESSQAQFSAVERDARATIPVDVLISGDNALATMGGKDGLYTHHVKLESPMAFSIVKTVRLSILQSKIYRRADKFSFR
jgi:hypothetical protein